MNGERRNGKVTYANGDIYDGQFLNDKRHGKGIYHYANGERYEGDYFEGMRQGQGTMYYKNGRKDEGEWQNDQFVKKSFFNKLFK